ncbi:MAG TPA: response regulator [Anaeromyxobacter sp.]|nr:response regulator [Anaeromyxobacter sp.]
MSSQPGHILVVDDNEALRENLAECLEAEGYQVAVAQDGPAALSLLERGPLPAVVLLDLMMPGMDGRAIAAAIRTNPRLASVRIVVSTGLSSVRGLSATADAVLMKPFGVKDLLTVLRRVEQAPPPAGDGAAD